MDSTTSAPVQSTTTVSERLLGLLVLALRAVERHVLLVVGEADLATAGLLRQHVTDALAARPPSLLIDLSALDFCDNSGLNALHDAARQALAVGVPMTFRCLSPQLAWLQVTFPSPRPDLTDRPAVPATPEPQPETGRQADRAAPASAVPDCVVPPGDMNRVARVRRTRATWNALHGDAGPHCMALDVETAPRRLNWLPPRVASAMDLPADWRDDADLAA